MISARDALDRLREGNRRFVSGEWEGETLASQTRRAELLEGQAPFAIILGCSDSRVPAEIVFGQGIGDLFVIRVAGNIVDSSQIGSVEFAAQSLGSRLVVVLGHTGCGAVSATIQELGRAADRLSPGLRSILDRVRPAAESGLAAGLGEDREALLRHATRANVRTSVRALRRESEVLTLLIESEGLLVVGGEYSLETGIVDFFDGLPEVR